ncbi:unnamed protein product [Merluccius merluccius]
MNVLVVKVLGLVAVVTLMLAGMLVPVHLLQVLGSVKVVSDFPLAETVMVLGFIFSMLVEQLVLTFRKEQPSFIGLKTFSGDDTPFIATSRPPLEATATPTSAPRTWQAACGCWACCGRPDH